MKVIIFKNLDKTCGVIYPSPEMFSEKSRTRLELKEQGIDLNTEKKILEFIARKDVPAGLEYRITDMLNIPENRDFRSFWPYDFDMKTKKQILLQLEFAKEEKIKQINEQRHARLDFTTPQTVTIYEANEDLANLEFEINDQCLVKWESRIRHLRDLEAAGEENATMPWIAVDTNTYWLNAAAYKSLVAHLIDRQNTEHIQARKRKNAVLDLTILEEVLAYDITQVYID